MTVDDPLPVTTMRSCSASLAMLARGRWTTALGRELAIEGEYWAGRTRWPCALSFDSSRSIAILEGRLDEADALATKVDLAESNAHLGDLGTERAQRQLALRRGSRAGSRRSFPSSSLIRRSRRATRLSGASLAYLAAETGDHQAASTRLKRVMDRTDDIPDDV